MAGRQSGVRAVGVRSDVRAAGILYAAAGALTWLVISLSEAVYPDYDVHTTAISALAALGSPTAAYTESVAVVWGLFWIVGSYILFRGGGKKGLMAANVLAGAGVLLAAASPANVNGLVHAAGSILAFVPGAVAILLSYRVVESPLRYFTVPLGALSLLGTIVEFGARGSSFMNDTLGAGGWERVIIYPILVWLVLFGGYLLGRAGDMKEI